MTELFSISQSRPLDQRQSLSRDLVKGVEGGRRHQGNVLVFHDRLRQIDAGLTKRELSVCALALAGTTIEGTALNLGLKNTSVITYRKRAYGKLGISSINEMFSLIYF